MIQVGVVTVALAQISVEWARETVTRIPTAMALYSAELIIAILPFSPPPLTAAITPKIVSFTLEY